jgi:hypothetical protein
MSRRNTEEFNDLVLARSQTASFHSYDPKYFLSHLACPKIPCGSAIVSSRCIGLFSPQCFCRVSQASPGQRAAEKQKPRTERRYLKPPRDIADKQASRQSAGHTGNQLPGPLTRPRIRMSIPSKLILLFWPTVFSSFLESALYRKSCRASRIQPTRPEPMQAPDRAGSLGGQTEI